MYTKIAKRLKIVTVVILIFWLLSTVLVFGVRDWYMIGQEKIQYKITTKKNPFIQKGWKIWLREGRYGYKKAVYNKIELFGNEIQNKPVYETEVIKKPISAFLINGTSNKSNPISVPKECYAHYAYDMESTAYDPSPESNSLEWAGITALGWHTRYGIAAVDPKVIALRSLIFVEGYGFAWAGDTGGDIKGKRIDLCYNTTKEALSWGRRKTKVYILSGKSWDFFRNKTAARQNNEK